MSRQSDATTAPLSTDATTERHEPRFTEAAWLIAAREVSSRLRSKAFVISTIVLMAAVLASVILGSVFASNSEPTKVAVVGAASDAVSNAATLEAESDLSHDVFGADLDAAIVPKTEDKDVAACQKAVLADLAGGPAPARTSDSTRMR